MRAVIEIVVGEVVDGNALRRQSVPRVDVEGEQRRDAAALRVAQVMAADLPVIVRQPVRKRLRLRQQQQPRVFVGVTRQQYDLRRLNEFLAVGHVRHAGDLALVVGVDRRHVRARHDFQLPGFLRARNGRHARAVLGVDVAAALVAEAVIHARGAVLIRARVDRGGPGKRVPAEAARRGGHQIDEAGAAQRRHRVRPLRAALRRCCRAYRWRP